MDPTQAADQGGALIIPADGDLPKTSLSSMHCESDLRPASDAERVRVVRVLVYEGERDHVERTIGKSLHGQCVISKTLTIKGATVEGKHGDDLTAFIDFGPQVFGFGYLPKGSEPCKR